MNNLSNEIIEARKNNLKEIRLTKGIYYLKEPIKLTTRDSGLKIIGESPENTTISGGKLLTNLKFFPYKNGIMQANLDVDFEIDQLLVNDKLLDMARFPNKEKNKNVYDAWNLNEGGKYSLEKDAIAPERIKSWKNVKLAYFHAMHSNLWGDMHWKILGVNSNNTLKMVGGWQNNRESQPHNVFHYVENIFEELDTQNEWYYDKNKKILYIYPDKNTDLNNAKIESVNLKNLFEVTGDSSENLIKNITFENLRFTHAARTFMENKEPLFRSDWTLYRGAAIEFRFSEDCTINNCNFENLGGNAIIFDSYNKNNQVKDSLFKEIGASGVIFAGRASAVRDACFDYSINPNFQNLDKKEGPQTEEYPRNCLVENCLITRTGRQEKQTAPIQISVSSKILVRKCSIYNVPRAGININEGTFGGHIIENCDIFNTVLETGDHGSFNSWGRDRFWQANLDLMDKYMENNSEVPFLDAIEQNIIRKNRFRCDHGWDIDLDDGSTNYLIEKNLLLNGGLKLREGYKRIARNNLIFNNSLHAHCWLKNSKDEFYNNVVYGGINFAGRSIYFGEKVDYNIYTYAVQSKNEHMDKNWNKHSLYLKPLYKDLKKGDYTILNLPEKSPFKNLQMNIYGVKCPRLAKIALQPKFDYPQNYQNENNLSQYQNFIVNDMILRRLNTKLEFSAYGTTEDTVGFVVVNNNIKPLENNDLIVKINDKEVEEIKAFEKNKEYKITVIREQKEKDLKVTF